MEHPEERYYKLNRFFLRFSGLWPYQSAKNAHIIRAFITVLVLSYLFVQIMNVFTSEITMDYLTEMIPMIIPTMGTLTHFYSRIIYIDKLKELFDRIWNDWALQKTEDEEKIMHKHAGTSRSLSIYFMLQIYVTALVYIVFLYSPEILDIVSPMNESRPRSSLKQYFKVQYFVPEEQYISFIWIHICIVYFITTIIFITCFTLFIAVAQHVCGMCELLGYRAERLFYVVESTTECDLSRRTKLICRNTAVFIQLHHNVIEFVGVIEHLHALPFLMDFVGVLIVLCFTLMQIIFNPNNIEKAIRCITYVNLQIIYITLSNYLGQKIMDNSSSIYDKVYSSAWYDMAVAQQKPLLLIMKRRFRPLVLTASKFYVMSLPSLGKILQTTVSYCMYMRQF